MHTRPLFAPRALLAALTLALTACAPPVKDRVALIGVNVLDGTGGPLLEDQVIIVHGNKIETIAPREGFEIPKTATEVDLTGKWVIPGLIDAHAHVDRWSLSRFLAFGVTSVRDLHHQQDSILALRDEVATGAIRAPRLYIAGAMIDADPATWPGAEGVADADAARHAVDQRAVANIPVVKTYVRVTQPMLKAIVDEATSLDIPVASHLGLVDAVTAARLGVRSIEHLTGVPEAVGPAERFYAAQRKSFFTGWTLFETSWAGLDSAALSRVAGELAQTQVTLVPTLVLHETWSRLDDPAVMSDADLAYVPQATKEEWDLPNFIAGAGWDAASFTAFRASRAKQDLFLREFLAAGGTIVAGTDATNPMIVPGASMHRELALLVGAGLSPYEALLSATRRSAALIGADSIGVLAAGKLADLVVLDADPRADIANTRRILQVMLGGQLMPHDSLDLVARLVTFTRLLLATAAVAAWLLALGWATRRIAPATPALRPWNELLEAGLLSLFAGLWFASLGHGGWWLLFLVVALLIEGPARIRHRAELPAEGLPWRPLLLGILRTLGAGAILSLLL